MADVSVTAASVLVSNLATVRREYTAGETLTAGLPVYLNSANQWLKSNNAVAAGHGISDVFGIALGGAAINQPIDVAVNDVAFVPGFSMTVGETYIVSNVAGNIAPIGDIATGRYTHLLGVAKTATILVLNPTSAGVAKA